MSLCVLPKDIVVIERGWLSSNSIVLLGENGGSVVDTGYCTHAEQTVSVVQRAIAGQPLRQLLNTHLHSDHCGGNAALQLAHPGAKTLVPPGLAHHVRAWDSAGLTFNSTGQACPRFTIDGTLEPGSAIQLGNHLWEVHAAPGHDPHSVVLFQPDVAVLISADALWENGFGVVFPELEGEHAFAEVAATLDVIEKLAPRIVIPGHGSTFSNVQLALKTARLRLQGFVDDPAKHARYAAKVLLKFKLLELQAWAMEALLKWAAETAYLPLVHQRWFADQMFNIWVKDQVNDLVRSGAARWTGDLLLNN